MVYTSVKNTYIAKNENKIDDRRTLRISCVLLQKMFGIAVELGSTLLEFRLEKN